MPSTDCSTSDETRTSLSDEAFRFILDNYSPFRVDRIPPNHTVGAHLKDSLSLIHSQAAPFIFREYKRYFMREFAPELRLLSHFDLNDRQRGALLSLACDIGCFGLASSRPIWWLRHGGNMEGGRFRRLIRRSFTSYCYKKNEFVLAMYRRRVKEADYFLGVTHDNANGLVFEFAVTL